MEQNKTKIDAYQILSDAGLTHDEIFDNAFKIYAAYISVIFDQNPEQHKIESRACFENNDIAVIARRCLQSRQTPKH